MTQNKGNQLAPSDIAEFVRGEKLRLKPDHRGMCTDPDGCMGTVMIEKLSGAGGCERVKASCTLCDHYTQFVEITAGGEARTYDPSDPGRSVFEEGGKGFERQDGSRPKLQPTTSTVLCCVAGCKRKCKRIKPARICDTHYSRWNNCGKPPIENWILIGGPTATKFAKRPRASTPPASSPQPQSPPPPVAASPPASPAAASPTPTSPADPDGFEVYNPYSGLSHGLEHDICSLTSDGRLTLSHKTLARIGLKTGDQITVLMNHSKKQLALRKPLDGERTLKLAGKSLGRSSTVSVAGALRTMGLKTQGVCHRYPVDFTAGAKLIAVELANLQGAKA